MESLPQRTPEITGSPHLWSYPSSPTGPLTIQSVFQFFQSAPPLASDAFRVERLLATARLLLAIGTLVTFGYAATTIGATAFVMIVGFTIYSAIAWSALRAQSASTGRLPISLHVLDLSCVAAMTMVTGGITSPLLGLFLFVLLEAAYRWGFAATMATIAAMLFLLIPQAIILNADAPKDMLFTRTAYLTLGGVLVGFVAGREKQYRDESATIARLTAAVRVGAGIMGSLKALFPELLQLSGARAVLLVTQEPRDGRLCLWQMDDSSDLKISSAELVPSEHDAYLFPMAGDAWHAVSAAAGLKTAVEVFSLESDGRVVKNIASPLPDTFAERHPFESLIGISLNFGGEWQDRFFLLDPSDDASRLPFLLRLMRELGPALQSVYVQSRMNSRVGERERARVARELHDSTVQSLIGLEMELAAWRKTLGERTDFSHHLSGIQQRLREEIVGLRELMQQLRPVDVDPARLMSYLSDMVDRFQRETGIAASFVSNVQAVDMSQEVCCGLIRILQEALVNVRKHSGARNVYIRFGREQNRWALVVDDDGRGFDFVGRRAHVELDEKLNGPSVIKERVRGLGGELAVDSEPARGARLEVTLPGAAGV
jgi:signal transduction histidine kinase